jgi:hypothetical protein
MFVNAVVVTAGAVGGGALSFFLQLEAIISGRLMHVSLIKRVEENSFIIVGFV